ncbi:hypothetical protein, partial [Hymenobacter defluvii]
VRLLDEQNPVDLVGDFEVKVKVEHNLRAGSYILLIGIDSQSENIYYNPSAIQVEVLEFGTKDYKYKNYGLIDAKSTWEIKA